MASVKISLDKTLSMILITAAPLYCKKFEIIKNFYRKAYFSLLSLLYFIFKLRNSKKNICMYKRCVKL